MNPLPIGLITRRLQRNQRLILRRDFLHSQRFLVEVALAGDRVGIAGVVVRALCGETPLLGAASKVRFRSIPDTRVDRKGSLIVAL